jgi:hypothetical protein
MARDARKYAIMSHRNWTEQYEFVVLYQGGSHHEPTSEISIIFLLG